MSKYDRDFIRVHPHHTHKTIKIKEKGTINLGGSLGMGGTEWRKNK